MFSRLKRFKNKVIDTVLWILVHFLAVCGIVLTMTIIGFLLFQLWLSVNSLFSINL